jgi:CPA2 family monovalent cation:H+ antiporter-2
VIAEDISALPASESSQPISPVIIAGYGRVGQNIAKGLQDTGIPYTVIEIDPSLVYDMRCGGVSCIYGDASNAHVLSRVDVNKAKVLAVTFPDPLAVVTTIQAALKSNPKLKVVARAHRAKDAELLAGLGVTELISPEYEAGLEFISRILSVFGWKGAEIKRALAEVQQDEEITEFGTEE